jgi:hypothetical protein
MKILSVFFILITLGVNMKAQLYTEKKQFQYIVYHITNNDTIDNVVVNLYSSGKKWISPKDNLPITDSWVIEWSYYDTKDKKTCKEATGAKITSKEIFLHPIRLGKFRCLEFCPFPMVHKPVETGAAWNWTLNNINDIYYPPNSRKIQRVINKYQVKNEAAWYDKINKKHINCHSIEATGNSPLGKTKLVALYSPYYGFVRMEFYTIDKDYYIFDLQIEKTNLKFN